MKEKIIKKDFYQIITIEELRAFLRITGTHDDLLLQNFVESAISYAEGFVGLEIQKKEILLTGEYRGEVMLRGPLINLISVKVPENEHVTFAISGNKLEIHTPIETKFEVLYVAGLEEDEMWQDLKVAMMMHISYIYNSGQVSFNIPRDVLQVYYKYKKIRF